jgi:tetratricopeptide (TPR) repeat protein
MKVLAALTHFSNFADLSWISKMGNISEVVAEIALEDLSDRSILVSSIDLKKFFLPPLAAQFIRQHRPEIVETTGNMLANQTYELVKKHGGSENAGEGYKILEDEWQYIEAAIPILSMDNGNLQFFRGSLEKFFRFSGKWEEGLALHQLSEQKALSDNDFYSSGWCALDQGWLYYYQGKHQDVLSCVNRAESYWKLSAGVDNKEKAASTLLRGLSYKLKKEYDTALQWIKESLSLRKLINPTSKDVSVALNDLAQLQRIMGNSEEAEKYYKESIWVDEANGWAEGMATHIGNLAELYLDRKQWEQAESLIFQSLKLAENFRRQDVIAKNHRRIAICLLGKGFPEQALPHAKTAVEIMTQLQIKNLPDAQKTLSEIKSKLALN